MAGRLIGLTLLVAFGAACGSDAAITTPDEQATPGPLLAIGTDPVSGATIETNLDDYMPGEVVHVTGRGWAANETVRMFMTEDPDTHDDVSMDVVADSAGGFSVHFYDVQPHDRGVTFTLVATGLTLGSRATAVFTDGATIVSIQSIDPASPLPGQSFEIDYSVDINGGGVGRTWKGTAWWIDSGAETCVNTVDVVNVNGVYPGSITGPIAPLLAGGHTLHMAAYEDDGCTVRQGGIKDFAFTVQSAANQAPVVDAGIDSSFNEGSSLIRNGSFTDPDTDPWTATVDYGDGSGVQALTLVGKTYQLNHQYDDDGTYVVTVTISDGTVEVSDQATMTVNNVAPSITAINLPDAPIQVGGNVSVSWTFDDPNSDTWECQISWDQPVLFGAIFASSGKTCTASTTTLPAGVYTVTVYVKDDDDGEDTETATAYIVVYDPNGGFVTGGGWIMSPEYALPDLKLTGKATFGFISKYVKNKSVPEGNTEFQFHAGNLNFKSTSYEWLVVSGPLGQYKGVGTINGEGNYGFLLTAKDGQAPGGGGYDKFRIKIWEIGGDVVYDNGLDAPEDSDVGTMLGGGSIVIHSKK
jgi:hypothetical protein